MPILKATQTDLALAASIWGQQQGYSLSYPWVRLMPGQVGVDRFGYLWLCRSQGVLIFLDVKPRAFSKEFRKEMQCGKRARYDLIRQPSLF